MMVINRETATEREPTTTYFVNEDSLGQTGLVSDIAHVSSKMFLDIHATIECGFTLKRLLDMIRTCRQ